MSDILERWPILDLYELLTGRSARFQETKSGLVKPIRARNGKRFLKCPNPAHPDRRPSCRFNENSDHFKCFSLGCGGNGRKVDLIRLALGMPETASNSEAIARLKELDPSWTSVRDTLANQPPADSRFADGEWVHLENEHLAFTFPYFDLDNQLRYQVLRYHGIDPESKEPGKRFAQRRRLPSGQWVRQGDAFIYLDLSQQPVRIPDGSNRIVSLQAIRADGTERAPRGAWFYNLDGIDRIPYRLRELRRACAQGRIIFVVEGEMHADILRRLGFAATSNSEGTSFHYPESWRDYFAGARAIFIIPDCDESGRFAARMRARVLDGVASIVSVLDLWPERNDKYDIADFVRELSPAPLRSRASTLRALFRATFERDGLLQLLAA